MKKIVLCLAIAGAVFSLSSCKSTESAYKKAYEKAVQEDVPAQVSAPAEVTPVKAVESQAPEKAEDVAVREEKVSVVSGDQTIKAYGIVCGSFSLKTNADALRERLLKDGYPAVVVVNQEGRTYRVVCESFDNKQDAVNARAKFKANYPNNADFQAAWILYSK